MSINREVPIISWILLFAMLGGLFSCGLAFGIGAHWFVPWHTLPETPYPIKSIGGATIEKVDVEILTTTNSSSFLRFNIRKPEQGWVLVDAPDSKRDRDCTSIKPPRQPTDIVDQMNACYWYADTFATTRYILRKNGRIEYWIVVDNTRTFTQLLQIPMFGTILGVAFGGIFGLIDRRNQRKKERAELPCGSSSLEQEG